MVSPQNPTAPVKEGDVLAAKYRIEKVIGVGGMGIVVSAMHLELDQRVALKFLLPQAATNDELVGRFVREAKASVKLKGTHVAKVLDVGRMDDGRAYIVMEYLDGRDLGAELKASNDQFPIEDAVSWMLQACEGLAEAHALGIVHRDLKPGNLFLTRGLDGRSLVKVLDFGISKSINPNSSDMLSLTKTEMLLGSPLYMAPEQMRSSKYVDERSDIWALGAIAYELLTRRVPFEAETLLDLCFKVAQEGCQPVHELRPEVPLELSDVVMRCLEKDPEARWTDIGGLATALEAFAAPSDHGSAARTISVLSAGVDRALLRRSNPDARASSPGLPAGQDTLLLADAKDTTGSGRRTDSKRTNVPNGQPPSGSKNGAGERIVSGTATTESAVTDEPSAPDAVPASSAWGTTNASSNEKSKSRRGVYAVAGAAVVLAAAGFALSRGSSKPPTVQTSSSTGATSSAPAVAIPPASETAVATSPPPSESASVAPAISVTAPAPARETATIARPAPSPSPSPKASAQPKATASAPPTSSAKSPEPASSGGFIRVRE
ncbi:MAG: protein kinase [Labilithrix sp.]|nr:protein kinase [Labilithrix sp.]